MAVLSVATFLCVGNGAAFAASGDMSVDGGTIITISASFCNANLICDPEENYIACPSDCEAPPEPVTPDTNTTRTPSGYRTRVERGNTVYLNEIESDLPEHFIEPNKNLVTYVEDFVSDGISSAYDIRLADPGSNFFSKTLHVSVIPNSTDVVFEWYAAGQMIRIMRADDDFPKSALEGGVVVYEGAGTVFVDTELQPQKTYYYSLFVKNTKGDYGYRERVVIKTVENTMYVDTLTHKNAIELYKPRSIVLMIVILFLMIISWRLFTRALAR